MTIRLSTHGWCVLIISILVIFLYYLSSFNPIGHLKGEVTSVRRLLTHCIHLSEEAGGLIKFISLKHSLNSRTKHGGMLKREPLTDADLGSHQIIVSGLTSAFPELLVRSKVCLFVFILSLLQFFVSIKNPFGTYINSLLI